MKLGEIAARLKCALEGDAEIEISGVAGIEEAQPGQLTFLANRRYRLAASKTRASAIIVPEKEEGLTLPCLPIWSGGDRGGSARPADFSRKPALPARCVKDARFGDHRAGERRRTDAAVPSRRRSLFDVRACHRTFLRRATLCSERSSDCGDCQVRPNRRWRSHWSLLLCRRGCHHRRERSAA